MAVPKLGKGQSSQRFKRVREAHRTELAEDYVELIAEFTERNGEARLVDLSKELGVTKATVNNAIRRLQRDGLVTSQPYRAIFLTDKGEKLAKASRKRHLLVRQLLIALGVDAKTAEVDAEGMEHHVSERTLDAFRKYLALR
jgi:DtxR family manganese transport transcriptional regulator